MENCFATFLNHNFIEFCNTTLGSDGQVSMRNKRGRHLSPNEVINQSSSP